MQLVWPHAGGGGAFFRFLTHYFKPAIKITAFGHRIVYQSRRLLPFIDQLLRSTSLIYSDTQAIIVQVTQHLLL